MDRLTKKSISESKLAVRNPHTPVEVIVVEHYSSALCLCSGEERHENACNDILRFHTYLGFAQREKSAMAAASSARRFEQPSSAAICCTGWLDHVPTSLIR